MRCNVAASLGPTDPWTPASTPLHFAARGRPAVVLAILQAAARRQQQGLPLPIDPRLLSDFRGVAGCRVGTACLAMALAGQLLVALFCLLCSACSVGLCRAFLSLWLAPRQRLAHTPCCPAPFRRHAAL